MISDSTTDIFSGILFFYRSDFHLTQCEVFRSSRNHHVHVASFHSITPEGLGGSSRQRRDDSTSDEQ